MPCKNESVTPLHSGTETACRQTKGEAALAPLLLRAPEAAALCHTSLRTWRAWDAAGKVPSAIRIGRSTFWRPEDLRAWVEAGCPDRATWEAVQQ
jgi:predicted DNA-binding transcriptional regulator AlpA